VTNDALWDWNMTTNEVYRNSRHATMLGYEPQELTASQEEWEKRIHPDDRQAVLQILNEHIAGKRDSIEIEYRLRTKSDDYVWVLGRGKIVAYNDDGSPARMIGTNIDITERKRAEEAKTEYETLIRGIVDNSGSIVVVRNLQGQYLMVNTEVEKVLGMESEQIIGKTPFDIHTRDKANNILIDDKKVIDSRCLLEIEDQLNVKGEIRIFQGTRFPLINSAGEVYAVCTVATDITERKQAEEEIRKFKTIADKAGHGVAIAGLQGNLVYVNDSFAQMHQYSIDELIGKNLSIFHNEEQMKRVYQLNDQLKQQGSYVAEEVWHKKRDNTVFPTLMSATLVRDESGEPLFMAATAIDITKHKKAEEALQESELRYRTLFETLPVGVGLVALDGRIIDTNSTMLRMMGFSLEEIMQLNARDLYRYPEERTLLLKQLQQDGLVRDFETEFKHRDGSIYYTNLNVTAMKIRDETVLVTVAKDITEQKNMERALAESEEKYRTLVECAGDPIFTIDERGVFLFANKKAEEDFTDQTDGLVGKTLWDLFPMEMADQKAVNVRKVIETGQRLNTVSLSEVQGRPRWYNVTIEPLRDDRGSVTSAMVIARNIDEMKRAEEQIKKLSSAVEQSIDGVAISDLETRLLYVNDAYARMHGYTPEEMRGMKIVDVYTNKSDEYDRTINQRNTKGSFTGEVEHVRKDGTTFPAYLSVTLLKDDKEEAVGSIAICRDMTQYKQTLETLKIKEAAIASSTNGIAIGDAEGNITYVNHAFLEMWGYENENEVLGRNAVEFWGMQNEAEELLRTLQDRKGWIGELTAKKKDGSAMIVQVCATFVTDENGRSISMMGSFVDITESKRREDELSKYRGQMARAEQLASLGTLSATVAHQLTQPLTVIRLSMDNALDELEATSSSETVIRRLKDSVIQVSNITSIIENFRNFARKSSGKTVSEINLNVVAVRIARLLSESARGANIVLRLRNMGELPCPWMNETDLEQLFFALIENSIQAADGKKTRQLVISGAAKDKHIELRLSDDCGGITPENIDKIFEPFLTTKPRGQGTGLGLCIVQDVVSRIGGHVRVESEFGKGTTFIISLPFEQGKIL
jgi:PAS domain S-box-containing protein